MNCTFGDDDEDGDNGNTSIQDEAHNFSTSRLNILTPVQQNEEEMEDFNVTNDNHFTDDSHILFRSSSDSMKTKEFVCTNVILIHYLRTIFFKDACKDQWQRQQPIE